MEEYEMNTVEVNLDEVKKFIESDKFLKFLIENNSDITVPMFILQILEEKVEELER